MGDWAALPDDILVIILQLIVIGKDHCSFGCVCRSWRRAALLFLSIFVPKGAPCLIVPDKNTSCSSIAHQHRRLLLAFQIGKDIAEIEGFLPQIRIPPRDICLGSYQGWLVMISKYVKIYIWNPFSCTSIDLLMCKYYRLSGLQLCMLSLYEKEIKLAVLDMYISKAILSTVPTAPNCFIFIIYGYKNFAFCNVSDKVWRYMFRPQSNHDPTTPPQSYTDAVYFKGQFYIVSASGEIFSCDVTASRPGLISVYGPPPKTLSAHQWYLVECRGELYRVMQQLMRCRFAAGKDDDACIGIDNQDLHQALDEHFRGESYGCNGFEVHKLMSDTVGWIQVRNFEGNAVFLGRNQSFSLSNPGDYGYKRNRIYFTDHRSINNDMGVFNLEDGTMESPLYKTNSRFIVPPAIWMIPNT
ncbi:unnamed protein product [Cuscuta epithymum]|uniref:DUF295 domain-containing protein n=1 Tax=Cuscuta epithymum TaxID=186058 RepID=A0AAV0DEB6_9ASTE|nr:unnamed protein product [Cuscuta epithymum]